MARCGAETREPHWAHPILSRVILGLAGAALLTAVACVAAWRWWLTRGDGQDVVESPKGSYRVVFTARTQWIDVLPNKNVTVDVEHHSDQLVGGLSLYKLHPDEDFRTSRYDRYWTRENVLHLRSNEQIADDCDELVVRNDTQDLVRYLVVHTRDIVLLLNLGAGEQIAMAITRHSGGGGYIGARGAYAMGQKLLSRQRYRRPGEEHMRRRFIVAVKEDEPALDVTPLRAVSVQSDCRPAPLPIRR